MISAITSSVPQPTQAPVKTAAPVKTNSSATPEATGESGAASQSHAAASASADTVHISLAAQNMQELNETSAQTAKEAGAGDHQAQRLLAKEQAAARLG